MTRKRRKGRKGRNEGEFLAHAHSKIPTATVAVSHRLACPDWERIAQQLKLSSPQQRPAPRMPTFLLHPASCSEQTPLPPPLPTSPPHNFHQPTFNDSLLSSSCGTEPLSPGEAAPNKVSVFQPSLSTSPRYTTSSATALTRSHLPLFNVDHRETLLPPSAFAIPTCTRGPDHHRSSPPASLDLSDPATQQEILHARDSLREVIRLKTLQR